MRAEGATGRVKIVKIPRGEAPENIRAAWVGLELPCYPTAGYIDGVEFGFESGLVRQDSRACVIVPQKEALEVLEKSSPAAAKWWYDRGFPLGFCSNFSFGVDEVALVSGVRLQNLIEVTDEMRGDPYR